MTLKSRVQTTLKRTGRPLWKVSITALRSNTGARAKNPWPISPLTEPIKSPINAPSVLKYAINENAARIRQTTAIISRLCGGFTALYSGCAGVAPPLFVPTLLFVPAPLRGAEDGFPRFDVDMTHL